MEKRTGTDKITRTVVWTAGQVSTTVVTTLTVDSDGVVSPTAKQYAFTSAGTGDNHEFAMTPIQEVSTDNLSGDLLDVANSVGEYKNNNGGDSPLQTKADNINKGIAIGSTVATASVAAPLKGVHVAYKVGAAASTVTVSLNTDPIFPEMLYTTHKFEKEEIK